jgi:hypothetical protein
MRPRGSLILTRLLFALVLFAVFASPAYCGILVYVTNSGAAAPGTTAEYTGAGAFVQNFDASPAYTGPDAIALDASGNVFVGDAISGAGANRIVSFASNGTQLGVLNTAAGLGYRSPRLLRCCHSVLCCWSAPSASGSTRSDADSLDNCGGRQPPHPALNA